MVRRAGAAVVVVGAVLLLELVAEAHRCCW
jgi:hypothetical protein